jgi:hypothetical protein
MCTECHGAGGAGGDAPSLNRPRLLHAPTDVALVNIIQNGIPNTAMPPCAASRAEASARGHPVAGQAFGCEDSRDARKGAESYKSLGARLHIIGAGRQPRPACPVSASCADRVITAASNPRPGAAP